MSARKSSHGTIFLIVSSGSPLALIASSLRSTSKKPFCPMTRLLHPPMAACDQRVRFETTWREEFFEVPSIVLNRRAVAAITFFSSVIFASLQKRCPRGRGRTPYFLRLRRRHRIIRMNGDVITAVDSQRVQSIEGTRIERRQSGCLHCGH